MKQQFEIYLKDFTSHPIFKSLQENTHLNINKEERMKNLNLTYFDDYITSDEENDFEEKENVEEGEIVDPMMIQQFEHSSSEDAAE